MFRARHAGETPRSCPDSSEWAPLCFPSAFTIDAGGERPAVGLCGHQVLFITRPSVESTNIQGKICPHFSFNSTIIPTYYSSRYFSFLASSRPAGHYKTETGTESDPSRERICQKESCHDVAWGSFHPALRALRVFNNLPSQVRVWVRGRVLPSQALG